MLKLFRAAGLILPALLALCALALLIGLGTWQMQRKAWKDALVAQIRERTSADPQPLPALPTAGPRQHEPLEYTRIRMRGSFIHDAERHVYSPRADGPGWLVFTPLVVAGTSEPMLVMVNRGWVPEQIKAPSARPLGQIEGVVPVVGLLRIPEPPGLFTPANDARRNTWFSRDVAAMLAGLPESCAGECPRYYVDAEAEPANPGGWPRGGTTNFNLPNRHLEYALTWYGLAATLIGVFAAFAMSRLRGTGQ